MGQRALAADGSNAVAPPEVLGVVGECLHCCLLGLDPRLQRQDVLQLRTAVLADISERQVPEVHPMHDQWSGDSQDICRVVWTEFLVLGEIATRSPWRRWPRALSSSAAAFGGSLTT